MTFGLSRVSTYRGYASFELDGAEHVFQVELRSIGRDGPKDELVGRIVGVSRNAFLHLAGPILSCRIPGLFDGARPCLLHTDGALAFLRYGGIGGDGVRDPRRPEPSGGDASVAQGID